MSDLQLGGLSLLGDPYLDLGLLLVVGLLAGIINVMAGGGSFLMLPVLIGLGLPPRVANGTMRVAIVSQCGAAVATFHRKGVRNYRLVLRLVLPMIVGALIGSGFATQLDDRLFKPLIGIVLLIWAVVLAVKPDRFVKAPDEERDPSAITWVMAFAIGIYGGFLQAGVGFPLIAMLAGHLGYDLVRSNSIKVLLVLLYTLVALVVFAFAGQIAWVPALVLALGTMGGATLGTRWQVKRGSAVVRWFVFAMVTISGLLMLRSLIFG